MELANCSSVNQAYINNLNNKVTEEPPKTEAEDKGKGKNGKKLLLAGLALASTIAIAGIAIAKNKQPAVQANKINITELLKEAQTQPVEAFVEANEKVTSGVGNLLHNPGCGFSWQYNGKDDSTNNAIKYIMDRGNFGSAGITPDGRAYYRFSTSPKNALFEELAGHLTKTEVIEDEVCKINNANILNGITILSEDSNFTPAQLALMALEKQGNGELILTEGKKVVEGDENISPKEIFEIISKLTQKIDAEDPELVTAFDSLSKLKPGEKFLTTEQLIDESKPTRLYDDCIKGFKEAVGLE